MKFPFKKLLPHVVSLALFVLITLIYFDPILYGKRLLATDIQQSEAGAKELKDYYEKTGSVALWTNSMFGGMPAYMVWCPYSNNITSYLLQFLKALLPVPANLVLLYLVGMYILLCCLRVNPWLSFLGAIAFAFASYHFIIIEAGHYNKAMAVAFLPVILAGVMVTFNRNMWWGGLITAITIALQLRCNHIQITYYFFLSCLLICLVELFYCIRQNTVNEFVKRLALLVVAAIAGVGTNTSMLWSNYEYSKESIRGDTELTDKSGKELLGFDKRDVYSWSYGIKETMTFLIPNFYGGISEGRLSPESETIRIMKQKKIPKDEIKKFARNAPLYWGEQPFTLGPAYMGAIVCLLFILGLLIVDGAIKWWSLLVFLLTIMIAWGKNFQVFNDFLYAYVPFFSKFRSITMIHTISSLIMVLLGVAGVSKIINREVDDQRVLKALYRSFLFAGGFALLYVVMPKMFLEFTGVADRIELKGSPEWLIPALQIDRKDLLVEDALRTFAFVLLAAALIWMFVKHRIHVNYLLSGLIFLVLIDMWQIDKRHLNEFDFFTSKKSQTAFMPTRADLAISEDTDTHFRVFDLTCPTFRDARTSYYHKSLGGYHAAKLKRYDDLVKKHITEDNMDVLNMLNTKYLIVKQKNNPGSPIPKYNEEALGNAWFVSECRVVKNANQEIKSLSDFDPSSTAIVNKSFAGYLQELYFTESYGDTIFLVSYAPDHLLYSSKSEHDQLSVFSEIYYSKGWNAYIDNELVPHIRVNYILRALKIPAGAHKVEFKFEPVSYYLGEKISLAFSIMLLGSMLFLFVKEWKSKVKDEKILVN